MTPGRLHPSVVRRIGLAVLIAVLAWAGTARAQGDGAASTAGPRVHSFEVAGNLFWAGGTALGSPSATLTANQPGTPSRIPLFNTEARRQSSLGYGIRIALGLSRVVAVEAGLSRSEPALRVTVSGDMEGARPSTLSAEQYAEYLVDASLVLHVTGLAIRRRAIPYVVVGGGQLRQLDQGAVLVDTGATLHAGGGVKCCARTRRSGLLRGFGVRADARAYVRSRRLDFANKARTTFIATFGGFVSF